MILNGVVKSNKVTKALIVTVVSIKKSKKYKKTYKAIKNYPARCTDSNTYKIGQSVTIKSTRPLSKTINWQVVETK